VAQSIPLPLQTIYAELIEVLSVQRPFELTDAWQELLARGPTWRTRALEGALLLPKSVLERLEGLVGVLPRVPPGQ
jgi:hypothetical protein